MIKITDSIRVAENVFDVFYVGTKHGETVRDCNRVIADGFHEAELEVLEIMRPYFD